LSLKIDLHVHTCYSGDCATTLEEIVSQSKRKGLNGVAITDHNTIEGASKLIQKENSDLMIIPGIEVSTTRGHILGINVTALIPRGLGIEETVDKIHEADGIAIAAHPLAIYKKGMILNKKIVALGIDALEVVNASVFPFFLLTSLNGRFAHRLHLPQTGGSDAHLPEVIGLAYTIVKNEQTEPSVEDIIGAIKMGRTTAFGKGVPWTLRLQKTIRKKGK